MYEYSGAIHIHSNYSDGSGDVAEIGSIADETGLDFIILTDHNTLRSLDEGCEKFYGNTFMMIGCEINDKDNKNHLLALNIAKTPSTRLPAIDYTRIVKEQGGISFIAHPHEKRNSLPEHPPYPWTEWNSEDFTGIEIWNHMSEWMESLTEENKYQSFLHPLKTIKAPPKETLIAWDRISKTRKLVGIGGIDAHAHKLSVLGFVEVEIFPYKVLFKSIRTHVLTKKKMVRKNDEVSIANAKKQILDALQYGRCFVSNSYHGDATGFDFFAETKGGKFYSGDTVEDELPVNLKVSVPLNTGTIKLIHNGKLVEEVDGGNVEFLAIEAGIYRIEVYLGNKGWIFSNHIRIYPKTKLIKYL